MEGDEKRESSRSCRMEEEPEYKEEGEIQ